VRDIQLVWKRLLAMRARPRFCLVSMLGIDLRETDLRAGDFSGAVLVRGRFNGSDLRGANLRDSHLMYADFRGSNLRGADFSGANLRGVRFDGADLSGASFRDANLELTIFSRACMDGVDLHGTYPESHVIVAIPTPREAEEGK
jgi:uncharacterized protein YjbI with pentapeptide repeats